MLTQDSYDTEPWLSKAFNYLSQFLSNFFFPITFPKWLMKNIQGRLLRLSDPLFLNVAMTVFKIMIKCDKVFYKAKQECIKLNICRQNSVPLWNFLMLLLWSVNGTQSVENHVEYNNSNDIMVLCDYMERFFVVFFVFLFLASVFQKEGTRERPNNFVHIAFPPAEWEFVFFLCHPIWP